MLWFILANLAIERLLHAGQPGYAYAGEYKAALEWAYDASLKCLLVFFVMYICVDTLTAKLPEPIILDEIRRVSF